MPENFAPAPTGIPHLDQYFGPWAIQEEPFRAAVDRITGPGFDLALHLRTEGAAVQASASTARGYTTAGVEGNVAVVAIRGAMMKHQTSMSEGASTVLARRAIRAAVADKTIDGILLLIDSPGGTVSGTHDLAKEVAAANKQKPVVAYIEDLGASAAYWVASQASKIYANATALIGSIGTFAVLYDFSEQADKLGVKVHVVRAGEFKGMGTEGTEITDEQLAYWQGIVGDLNNHFLVGVAVGRKLPLSKVTEMADGRVHVGSQAQALGLIDGVQSYAATVSQLSESSISQKRKQTMSSEDKTTPAADTKTPPTPQPASFEELKLCCTGADAEFICEQLERKATLDQAQSTWMEEQNKRIEAAEKDRDNAKAAAKKPGVDPIGSGKSNAGDEESTDAVAEFNAKVLEQMTLGKTRQKAVAAVAKGNRELHTAYLRATNPQHSKVQSLIGERAEFAATK